LSAAVGSRAATPDQEEPVSLATITTYQIYLSIHILAAVIWVGGALAVQLFAIRAVRSNDNEQLVAITTDIEFIGTRLFIPASLVLVVFGFLLVGKGDWDYQFWIVFAICVWLASFIAGVAYLGPESGRISKAFAKDGPDSAEGQARVRNIFLISRIELTFLILVVLDMTLKPFS
jgi:uncharacterized membrane protein